MVSSTPSIISPILNLTVTGAEENKEKDPGNVAGGLKA